MRRELIDLSYTSCGASQAYLDICGRLIRLVRLGVYAVLASN